jgi:hypothetical protein
MNDTLTKGNADMGVCGRAFFYAMPYSLSLICTGFLEIWLLLLPIATVVDKGASQPIIIHHFEEGAPRVAGGAPAAGPPTAAMVALSVFWDLLMHGLACILTLGVDEVG